MTDGNMNPYSGNGYAGNPWGFWSDVIKNGTGFAGGGGSGNSDGGGSGNTPSTPGGSGNAAFNGAPAIDLFSTGSNYIIQPAPAAQNYMTQYFIPDYRALRIDLYFNDFSGGIDGQVRQINEGTFTNELSRSLLNASFARTLTLPPLVTTDTGSTNSIGTLEAMSACYLNDGGTSRWLVAAGDTANKCLFALTGSVTAQTYTPSSNIVSLTTVKLVTNTERVIVGRAGAAAQVLTGFNGTPTTSGTMHANTTQMWGVIRSPLNSTTQGAETLLLYCNDGLYSLSSATSAIGDAPTAILTNWPGGGYALGIATLSTEGVARAYWVHPLNDLSASALDTMEPCKIVSTNLEGTDPKNLDMKLQFVKHAMLWRGGIVATDGKQVHWNNGDVIDLNWNQERTWTDGSTQGFGTIQCLAVVDERLFIASSAIVGNVNDINYTVWEEYHPETGKWQFLSKASQSSLLQSIAACTGKSPVYQPFDTAVDSGYFYWYQRVGGGLSAATYEWDSIPLLADGVNPNWQQAATAWHSYAFAPGTAGSNTAAAYCETPQYQMLGMPLYVSDIWFGGQLPGTGSKVRIDIGEISLDSQSPNPLGTVFSSITTAAVTQIAQFTSDVRWQDRWWVNTSDSMPQSDRIQFRIYIEQATSGSNATKTSPNALPFRVGMYCFLNGQFTHPKTMEPDRYWGPREV